jgi:large subunit ribosomal protein L1
MAEAKQTKQVENVKEVVSEEPKEQTEVVETQAKETTTDATLAKAGKRSAKAVKEVEEKQAKEDRKAHKSEEEKQEKPKQAQKPPRSRMERRGKNYRKAAEQLEKGKVYSVADACSLATKTNPTKFDATVELHIRLNVDPKHADQNIRGTVVLPAGTGKTVRVAVLGTPEDVTKAQKAGADIAGAEEFLQQLDKGKIDFDVLVATPAMMPKLGKYARLLGPKGLMPNPKSGTVTADVAKAVTEAKAGRVEYRVDSTGIIHAGIGKVSFGPEKLTQNAQGLFTAIKNSKPASIKGNYVRSVFLTTSMGPSIPVELS